MEGGLDYVRRPLLSNKGEYPIQNGNGRVPRSNSLTSIKCDFFSNLPGKVLSGIDSEAPFQLDLSKTSGLREGKTFRDCHVLFILMSVFF